MNVFQTKCPRFGHEYAWGPHYGHFGSIVRATLAHTAKEYELLVDRVNRLLCICYERVQMLHQIFESVV